MKNLTITLKIQNKEWFDIDRIVEHIEHELVELGILNEDLKKTRDDFKVSIRTEADF